MFVLFLVPIVYCLILPCLFCDHYTNDALRAPFRSALRAFKRRVVYANADCDRILIICYIYNFLCGIHIVCFIIV